MPTYGWVYEDAEDLFNERGGEETPRMPPRFPCPICKAIFPSTDNLSWHVSTAHPIERPVLIVNGGPAPSVTRVRAMLTPADVAIANCTKARLSRNGHREVEISLDELVGVITSDGDAEHRIRLFNERAEDTAKIEAQFQLRITVPDKAELVRADERFVHLIAVDNLTMDHVDRFARETRDLRSARYYADALVAYAVGVLIKEGTKEGGAALPFSEFQGKLALAMAELSLFPERHVAVAVTTCARLNLNSFVANPSSGIVPLDESHKFFSRLQAQEGVTFPQEVDLGPGARPICPVDRDTHLVLRAFASLSDPDEAAASLAGVEERATDGTLSTFDRSKLAAIAVGRRLAEGNRADALPLLRTLAYDPHFGSWAHSSLDEGPNS